jgi:hypothetical protein
VSCCAQLRENLKSNYRKKDIVYKETKVWISTDFPSEVIQDTVLKKIINLDFSPTKN